MRLLSIIFLLSLATLAPAKSLPIGPSQPDWSVAFFYGANPPWDELQAFDLAVIDPDHLQDRKLPLVAHTRLAAYVSVGEVHPSRDYASLIPQAWQRGKNKVWGSLLIDQSKPEWVAFFSDQVIEPLWAQGFRTFFLDTLDSYQLFAKSPQEQAQQQAGLVAVIAEVVRRHPDVAFIYNRGFEILDKSRANVMAVAAESLYQRYDPVAASYQEVPEADRQWLLVELKKVRDEFKLPVIAIDYVPLSQRKLARETARRITALGITPWVATPDHNSLGVGRVEVMPRRVMVVHSPFASEHAQGESEQVRLLGMPLNYLGYVPEFVPLDELPLRALSGSYAGVVIWLDQTPPTRDRQRLVKWLGRQIGDGLPVAFINQLEFLLDSPLAKTMGLNMGFAPRTTAAVNISQQAPMMGFEVAPRPPVDGFYPLALAAGTPMLTLQRGDAQQVAAAITPWGGYALAPYTVVTLPGDNGVRWVIDPFAFLQQALRLPDIPVPDVTTESGRRMLMVHMDGDGFVSRSELPGAPLAGELVRDRVVRKYPLPMTISVIEAELSPQGLYPALSALAEQTARDIFSEPNVAIASHSYSHPFVWDKAGADEKGEGYHLKVPGYQFNLQREVEGSVRYIESRLAPAGKKVEMFFWSGDCIPGSDALAWTERLGLLNMNGGDTVATRSQPTVTQVEGLGIQLKLGYQVFAPNQNENVYTNNWLGPFYGYERVIETFEFTDKPRRLKPIDVYFHSFITTKRAGMQSLDKVLGYAMKQETTPVFVAQYARKVLDFQHMVVARSASGWRVRGSGELRTLRLASTMGRPDLQLSRDVAGYREAAPVTYVHLSSDTAEIALTGKPLATPRLESANARIDAFARAPGRYRWTLEGQVPLEFALDNTTGCRVRVAGKDITPVRRQGSLNHYALTSHAARPLEAICQH